MLPPPQCHRQLGVRKPLSLLPGVSLTGTAQIAKVSGDAAPESDTGRPHRGCETANATPFLQHPSSVQIHLGDWRRERFSNPLLFILQKWPILASRPFPLCAMGHLVPLQTPFLPR